MTSERIRLIDDLGAEFRRVARRPRRRSRLIVAIAAMLCLTSGVAVAAVSGLLPLGDALPVSDNLSVPPKPGSERASALRVADPVGGPDWTIEFFEAGGRGCVQVGRIQGDTFGSVGTDGRFHPQRPGSASYACGGESLEASRLQTADVRSAGPAEQMRYLRFGILGRDARSLTYKPTGGTPENLELTPEGGFLLVTEGQNAPAGELVARYSDGEIRRGDIRLSGAVPDAFVPRR